MIKKLLDKAKKNVYEIHCVKVDDLHSNQSVVGSISGGGKKGLVVQRTLCIIQ